MKAKDFLLQFSRSDITEAYYKFFLVNRHDNIEERERKREQAEKEAGLAYDEMKSAADSDGHDHRQTAWSWLLENDLEYIPEGQETEYAASLIKTFYRLIRKSEIASLAEHKEEEKRERKERSKKIAENKSVLLEATEASKKTNEALEDADVAALNLRIENEKRKERAAAIGQKVEERKKETERKEAERIMMAFSDPEEKEATKIENYENKEADTEKTKTAIDSPIAVIEATALELEEQSEKINNAYEKNMEIETEDKTESEEKADKKAQKKEGTSRKPKKKKERHKKAVAKRRRK